MSRLRTILIADDNPDLAVVIAASLADAGYAVLTAANGYDAIRVLGDNWVSLLITDITMPGIDGFEVARQAKVMRPDIKVIYLSGAPAESNGALYGPVIQKPMRIANLLGEV